jgi:diguanylate cyclase (GGDEF)-like protein/PAS domain S-box-containing protein
VDADQFRVFSDELLRRHPYLVSSSYLPRILENQRRSFERARYEAGFPGFAITDRSGDDYRMAPPRAHYFPLLFIEPFEPLSVTMIGFDVLADTRLSQSAQLAIDSAQPSAAEPQLIEGRVQGYWLFSPVYAGKHAPATTDERRQSVNALVALRINAERLLSESLAKRPLGARLMMIPSHHGAPRELVSSSYNDDSSSWAATVITQSSDIGSDGQRFRLDLQRAVSWRDINFLPVIAVFLTGLLTTGLLVVTVRRAAQRTEALVRKNLEVERLVTEKTTELALEKERAQVTLASIGDAVITTDAAGRVEYLNAVAETLTGWSSEEARGRRLIDVFRVQPADEAASPAGVDESATRDNLLVNRTFRKIPIDQSVAPILGRNAEVHGSVVVFRDVTEQRKIAHEMSYQAMHDALTGLYNRRAFEERLGQLLLNAESDRAQHALLYIDLDQFKIVNDACGHTAGDQLLRQLAAILRRETRLSDVLARLGGDELGILLHSCPADEAAVVARKLLQTINDFRFVWKERNFTIGASIGLVSFGDGMESAASVLSAADAACYAAKDKGRNRVLVYQADDNELSQRRSQMQWVTRLKLALDENRFVLYSQPVVQVAAPTAGPAMQEVLLRLHDEDGTLVPPGAFLPAAERYGLMPAIDRWVVRTTLQWLATHAESPGLAELYTINLSGHSLNDAPFLGFVLRELESSGVDSSRVAFEITESAAVAALDSAISIITTLKDKGCRFLLDDFGSGWSSFTYLKNLPVDFLKIDGGLVRDMADDLLDEAMVRSINEIGHVMGITTIAEFVESEAVLERLAILGVDYAQGYAIGRPAPIDAHLSAVGERLPITVAGHGHSLAASVIGSNVWKTG